MDDSSENDLKNHLRTSECRSAQNINSSESDDQLEFDGNKDFNNDLNNVRSLDRLSRKEIKKQELIGELKSEAKSYYKR